MVRDKSLEGTGELFDTFVYLSHLIDFFSIESYFDLLKLVFDKF